MNEPKGYTLFFRGIPCKLHFSVFVSEIDDRILEWVGRLICSLCSNSRVSLYARGERNKNNFKGLLILFRSVSSACFFSHVWIYCSMSLIVAKRKGKNNEYLWKGDFYKHSKLSNNESSPKVQRHRANGSRLSSPPFPRQSSALRWGQPQPHFPGTAFNSDGQLITAPQHFWGCRLLWESNPSYRPLPTKSTYNKHTLLNATSECSQTSYYGLIQNVPRSLLYSEVEFLEGDWIARTVINPLMISWVNVPLGGGAWLEVSHWGLDQEGCTPRPLSSMHPGLHDMDTFLLPGPSTIQLLPWS